MALKIHRIAQSDNDTVLAWLAHQACQEFVYQEVFKHGGLSFGSTMIMFHDKEDRFVIFYHQEFDLQTTLNHLRLGKGVQ